jgi:hypothetical protein
MSKKAAAAAAPARETVKKRPRKADAGHTAVERTSWTTKGGNERARVTCQCGETWEAYGERADKSYSKHLAAAIQPTDES